MNSIGLTHQKANLNGLYTDRRVSYVGHGQLESAPETFSALHVISHELGHAQEFRNQAFRDGAEVRSLDVKINYELRDGRMVAVSGETSAITQKRKESSSGDPSLQPYSDGKSFQDIFSAKSKEEDEKKAKDKDNELVKRAEHDKKEVLETRIKELEVRLDSEKKKEISQNKGDLPGEQDVKSREIAQEKRRLEEEVRFLKMKEEIKETFSMLTDIRKMMVSNVFGMMQVANDSKPGQFFETFI
ncbi:hypothetical protein LPTSP3_g29960 [Leptospira kobayashii]|uniref:Lipoprotein n=1 Tax=Leptospira kobayashii TaxID=1917830 RepID=A0ABM7UM27_9LEPT|nr:hypothetical protein [Leptospira kobayashii]BDA80066.1 hypothetical protein LPTSP3_g29960 [Leptospira kobayashii]